MSRRRRPACRSLLDSCGKLKSAGYTPIAFGNQFGWPAIHYLTQLNAYSVPPATLAKDYNPSTGAFTDPGYVQALTEFQSIVKTCSNPSANGLAHEAAQANFLSGKAAMHYLESVEFSVLTEKGGASKAAGGQLGLLPAACRRPAAAGTPRPSPARRTGSWSTGRASRPPWPWTS